MGVKISDLPAVETLQSDAEIEVLQNSVSRRAVATDFAPLVNGGELAYTGVRTTAALSTGENNDWNPDLSEISRLRISGAADAELTGMQGGTDGRFILLTNIGSETIIVRDESSSSSAANRFGLNGDVLLGQNQTVALIYDDSINRWSKFQ